MLRESKSLDVDRSHNTEYCTVFCVYAVYKKLIFINWIIENNIFYNQTNNVCYVVYNIYIYT